MAAMQPASYRAGKGWMVFAAAAWGFAAYAGLAVWAGEESDAEQSVASAVLGEHGYLASPLPRAEEAAAVLIPAALGLAGYRAAPIPGAQDAWQRYLAEAVAPLKAGPYVGSPLSRAIGRWEEIECLALTIYHEARGEGESGRRAVGDVVMNRVFDPAFPSTVCEVTQQGGEEVRFRCQFSWWCDGRSDEPRDEVAWRDSYNAALQVYWDRSRDVTEGALWYHADYVSPHWRKAFDQGPQIGRHVFYRRPEEAPAAKETKASAERPATPDLAWAL
ncbi:MAG: cell wall hydrolase [Kiloniellales bacterium]|nr:cell wall hydrolase [Kiloniellales bacterium]